MSLSAYLPRDDSRTVSPSSSSMADIEHTKEYQQKTITHPVAITHLINTLIIHYNGGRCGGLMVSALDSGSDGPGLSPGQGTAFIVFLGKKLNFHSASLHGK